MNVMSRVSVEGKPPFDQARLDRLMDEAGIDVLLATGESRVLSILLFTMFEQGQVTVVAAIGVLMIAVLLAIVAVFYKLTGRIGIQT